MAPRIQKACSYCAAFLLVATLNIIIVSGQESNSRLASIPGAKTATGILASSADGISRYFARDGPIQPAITAIGGLPMRGAEILNNGISRISSGFDNNAQYLANSAGNDGNIQMPGMDALESSMPASIANLGGQMHQMIQQKNKFIMGQAEKGVQAGNRLKSMMTSSIQGMHSKNSGAMVGMMNSMQEGLVKSTSQIQNQVKQSLNDKFSRLQGMQGIGQNVLSQAQGIGQTLAGGITGTFEHLQRTGQQVKGQIQGGLMQNTQAMSGIMDSMHGSMGNMGANMQKNLVGAIQHVQNTAHQVSSHIQQAASAPLGMIQSLSSGLGSMMMHSSGGGGGRY